MVGGLWAVCVGFRVHHRCRYRLSTCSRFGSVAIFIVIVIVYRFFLRYRTKTFRVSISNPNITHPWAPRAVFQARLLKNQEGANAERYVRLPKAL